MESLMIILLLILFSFILVYYINNNSTEMFSNTNKAQLVLYYTNWCGHSRQFLPVWNRLEQMYQNNASVTLTKVDCEKEKCDVAGFPTVRLYVAGNKVDYNGNRSMNDIVSFIQQNVQSGVEQQPALLQASPSVQNMQAPPNMLILYYTDWCGHSQRFQPIWNNVAEKLKSVVQCVKINCEKDQKMCVGVPGYPTVMLRANGKVYTYNGDRSEDDLLRFVGSILNVK